MFDLFNLTHPIACPIFFCVDSLYICDIVKHVIYNPFAHIDDPHQRLYKNYRLGKASGRDLDCPLEITF